MNRVIKIALMSVLFLTMLLTTVWAGNQQNLFTEFSWSGSPMWFKATIVDFYINQFILWLWVAYLEKNNFIRLSWLVIFICLGSMGTTAYVIIRLLRKKSLFSNKGYLNA